MKKRLLIILSIVLLVSVGVTLFFTLNSKERRLNIPNETIYSDFGALAKRKIQKLDSIPQTSPEEKAEFINGIDNEKLYEFCLTETLDIYYGNDDIYNSELEDFKRSISSKADEIIKNYEAAAEERETGEDKGYSPTEVLASFIYTTPYSDIATVAESIGKGYEIIADWNATLETKDTDLGILVSIDVDLDKTTEQTIELLEKVPCVRYADLNHLYYDFVEDMETSENVDEDFF